MKVAGHILITNEFGPPVEAQTRQCPHCQAHFVSQAGSGKQRSWCHNCAAVTCGGKACVQRCYPFEKQLEDIERRATRAMRGY